MELKFYCFANCQKFIAAPASSGSLLVKPVGWTWLASTPLALTGQLLLGCIVFFLLECKLRVKCQLDALHLLGKRNTLPKSQLPVVEHGGQVKQKQCSAVDFVFQEKRSKPWNILLPTQILCNLSRGPQEWIGLQNYLFYWGRIHKLRAWGIKVNLNDKKNENLLF